MELFKNKNGGIFEPHFRELPVEVVDRWCLSRERAWSRLISLY